MMKRLLFFILSATLFCAVSARANLGESTKDVESRYGRLRGSQEDAAAPVFTRYYAWNGLGISVKFMERKSQSESYLKQDKSGFSREEIAALLKANNLGSDWLRIYKDSDVERWELKTRTAAAFYYMKRHLLIISTKEFIRSGNKIKLIDQAIN